MISWLVRAVLLFVLFAFAMNNQHEVELRWFFGLSWRAPMVIVVLCALALGFLLGVLGMLPSWWSQRRRASRAVRRLDTPASVQPAAPASRPATPPDAVLPVRPDGV
ncbi:MAG: hypothetical protein RL375_2302 [Pseudomonadota bacterium]